MNPFKIIFAIDRLLVRLETFLLILVVVLLLTFAFVQVLLRNLFDTAIHWGDVFNRLMVLWIGFLAATVAVHENRHLSLEVLTKFIPEKTKSLVSVLVSIFVIVVTALLTHASCGFFKDQLLYEAQDYLFPGIPKAYFSVIFPVGFGLICFRYVVKLLREIYQFVGGDKAYPHED